MTAMPRGGALPRDGLILAVLLLAGLVYSILSSVVVPALPVFRQEMHATEAGVIWLLTAYLVAASVATPILGRLGDMYGKHRILRWTMLLLALGALLASLSHSLGALIGARALQGVGGGVFPLAFAIIRDELPPRQLARGIGAMSATLGIGTGVGIVISGMLVEHLSWRWLFWIPMGISAVTAVLVWLVVPASRSRAGSGLNWAAAALMVAGIAAVLIAVSEAPMWGWGAARTVGVFAAGAAMCGGWVAAEVRSPHPLVDMRMVRIADVRAANVIAFLLGGGTYGAFALLPEYAQTPVAAGFGFGASAFDASLYLLPVAVGMSLTGALAGRIVNRFGSRFTLSTGCAVAAVSFISLLGSHVRPANLLVCSALLGLGVGFAFAALGTITIEAVDATKTGVAAGVNAVMRTIGGAVGAQAVAVLVTGNSAHGSGVKAGFTHAFLLSASLLAVCSLGALASLKRGAPGGGREAVVENRAAQESPEYGRF